MAGHSRSKNGVCLVHEFEPVRDGRLHVAPGSGRFLPRAAGEAAQPLGRPAAEFAGSGAASRASAA